MAPGGSTRVARAGHDDKRAITLTLTVTKSGKNLPFQIIYGGKTARSLPKVIFPKGNRLGAGTNHLQYNKMAFEFSTRFTKGLKYSLTGGTRCKALASPVALLAPGRNATPEDWHAAAPLQSMPARAWLAGAFR